MNERKRKNKVFMCVCVCYHISVWNLVHIAVGIIMVNDIFVYPANFILLGLM